MQRTKDGYRWTIRLSNKDYSQKEVIRVFDYLLASGEYATETDISQEGIKSLYREKDRAGQNCGLGQSNTGMCPHYSRQYDGADAEHVGCNCA